MVLGHCAGSCTPSMGSPYPPCMMGATKCTIVRLLHNCGNGLGNGRLVVLLAVRPVQHQGGHGANWCVHYVEWKSGHSGQGVIHIPPLLWPISMSDWFADMGSSRAHSCGLKQQWAQTTC